MLNACYSEVQANAIVEHINYAIGMNHEIRDDSAIAFATGFYQALGYGQPIEQSYKFGCNAIQLQISDTSNFRSVLSEEQRKFEVAKTVKRVVIPEHLKPVLKIKPNLTTTIDQSNFNVSANLLPFKNLDIQSHIDKALEKEIILKQDPQQSQERSSSPKKTRKFFVGGTVATLVLVLTSFLLHNPSQPKQNQVNQPPEISVSSPNSAEMTAEDFFNSGLDKRKQGNNKGAIADYTQAIKLKPYYSMAYYNRGLASRSLGNNKTAIADYTQAIKIDQNWGEFSENYSGIYSAYYNRGFAYSKQGDNKRAIADYTQAIQLKPDSSKAFNNRGLAYSKQGDNTKAIKDYQKAAQLYQQQGDPEWYQKALNKINELQQKSDN